jgi:antitoxin PrlF
MESALSIKGQATIPKAVRDHLRLSPGDRIKFFMHPDGSVVILPKIAVTKLRGMVSAKGKRTSLEDMDRAVSEGASDGIRSSRR